MCYEILIVGIDTASFALANIAWVENLFSLILYSYLCCIIYVHIRRFNGIYSAV